MAGPTPDPDSPGPANVPTAAEYDSYFSDPKTKKYAFALLVLSLFGLALVMGDIFYTLRLTNPEIGTNATLGEVIGEQLNGDGFRSILNFLFAISIPCCGLFGAKNKQVGLISLFFYVATFIGTIGLISIFIGLVNPSSLPDFEDCKAGDPCFGIYQMINAFKNIAYLLAAVAANLFLRNAILATTREDDIEYAQTPQELQDAQIVRMVDNVAEEDQLTPLAEVYQPPGENVREYK